MQSRNQHFPIRIILKMYNSIKNNWALEKCANTESTWDLCEGQKFTRWKLESLAKFFDYYGIIHIY